MDTPFMGTLSSSRLQPFLIEDLFRGFMIAARNTKYCWWASYSLSLPLLLRRNNLY